MAQNLFQRRAPGATQPFVTLNPAYQLANRAPTIYDNYEPSTIWIEQVDQTDTPVNSIWILASVQNGQANWIQIAPNGGNGTFNNIFLPNTNAGGTVGVVYFGGNRFISNYANGGFLSTFVGENSGNFTYTGGGANTGVGANTLQAQTTGGGNTAVGENAGSAITTSNQNTLIGQSAGGQISTGTGQNIAVGYQSLNSLLTGNGNICLGDGSGNAYVAAESDNICIGNTGVATENGTIRIGTSATHVAAHIAGNLFVENSVSALGGGVFAGADPGGSAAGATGFGNATDVTQGVGVMTVLSTNGNPGNNTGYLVFYVNNVAAYVPYFLNIAP